jgi:hypothetical protein
MYVQIEATFEYPEIADKLQRELRLRNIKLKSFISGNCLKYKRIMSKRSFLAEISGLSDVTASFEDSSMSYHILPKTYPLDRKVLLVCRDKDLSEVRKILNGNGAYDVKETRI